MALIPDRAVVLTAASTDVADIMEAYYASLGTSAWTATNQVPTSTGGPGSFAMTLRNAAGTMELNILNYGDPVQAAGSPDPSQPHASVVRLGINPDGSADEITDCTDPYGTPGGTGPANYSGADNGPAVTAIIGSPEFIVLEWPDTLLFLFKDAAKNYVSLMWYWGQPWQTIMTGLVNSRDLRLDGHMIYQGLAGKVPSTGNYYTYATTFDTRGPQITRRIALGNIVDTAYHYTGGWARPSDLGQSLNARLVRTSTTYFRYGPDYSYIVQALVFGPVDYNASPEHYIDKYMRNVPMGNGPFDIWAVNGVNRYMAIWSVWSYTGYLAVPIPADFNPNP